MTDQVERKPKQPAPLVFVDCETDGLRWGRKAYEVAAVRREPDGTETEFETFIADVNLAEAELIGLKIGRFHTRHPQYADRDGNRIHPDNAPQPGGVLMGPGRHLMSEYDTVRTLEWMTRDAHFVANVPSFDAHVFATLFENNQLVPAWHYHLIDVENLIVGYLAAAAERGAAEAVWFDPEILVPPYDSKELYSAFGIPEQSEESRHTAMGDVRQVMLAYDKLMGGIRHGRRDATATQA